MTFWWRKADLQGGEIYLRQSLSSKLWRKKSTMLQRIVRGWKWEWTPNCLSQRYLKMWPAAGEVSSWISQAASIGSSCVSERPHIKLSAQHIYTYTFFVFFYLFYFFWNNNMTLYELNPWAVPFRAHYSSLACLVWKEFLHGMPFLTRPWHLSGLGDRHKEDTQEKLPWVVFLV